MTSDATIQVISILSFVKYPVEVAAYIFAVVVIIRWRNPSLWEKREQKFVFSRLAIYLK